MPLTEGGMNSELGTEPAVESFGGGFFERVVRPLA